MVVGASSLANKPGSHAIPGTDSRPRSLQQRQRGRPTPVGAGLPANEPGNHANRHTGSRPGSPQQRQQALHTSVGASSLAKEPGNYAKPGDATRTRQIRPNPRIGLGSPANKPGNRQPRGTPSRASSLQRVKAAVTAPLERACSRTNRAAHRLEGQAPTTLENSPRVSCHPQHPFASKLAPTSRGGRYRPVGASLLANEPGSASARRPSANHPREFISRQSPSAASLREQARSNE